MKQTEPKRAYLAPDVILSMLMSKDNGTLQKILNKEGVTCIISDYGLYEAVGSLRPTDKFNLEGLQLLLDKAGFIVNSIGNIKKLTPERIEHLRKIVIG